MTEDDKQAMDTYGITSTSKNVYYYRYFRYERLADAIRHAEGDTDRCRMTGGIS